MRDGSDLRGFALYADIVARFGDVRRRGNGLTFQCLFPERHKNGDQNPSGRLFLGNRGELVAVCLGCQAKWREFVKLVGVPEREWYPDRSEKRKGKGMSAEDMERSKMREVAKYPYSRIDGTIAAEKVRLVNGYGTKSFVWHRPLPDDLRGVAGIPPDAKVFVCGHDCMNGGWYAPKPSPFDATELRYWNCGDMPEKPRDAIEIPAERVFLYRVHEVAGANPELPVFVVEGEKDVHTLLELGMVATCPPHGANKWDPDAGKTLCGRRVVVVPDNDEAGKKHAERVIGSLVVCGAREVRAMWPDEYGYNPPAKGGDVTDWLTANHSGKSPKERAAALIQLCKKIVPYRLIAA